METLSPHMFGYGITTAAILYRFPDFQSLLQTFIWQDFDIEPEFPKLKAFLHFWESHLEGPVYSVDVVHRRLITENDIAFSKLIH